MNVEKWTHLNFAVSPRPLHRLTFSAEFFNPIPCLPTFSNDEKEREKKKGKKSIKSIKNSYKILN